MADWTLHDELVGLIKTDAEPEHDSNDTERTTWWRRDLCLFSRADGEIELIGQTWSARGEERIREVIAEGSPRNMLTMCLWRPGMLVNGHLNNWKLGFDLTLIQRRETTAYMIDRWKKYAEGDG